VKVAVITLRGSRYGLRLLNALARQGRRAQVVLVLDDGLARRLRLLMRVVRQVGARDAALLAAERQLAAARARRERRWRGAPLTTDYAALADVVVRAGSLQQQSAADALHGTDLVLLGQSGIVPAPLLALASVGTLNAHPGALPKYRGLDAPLWALVNEDFDRVGSSLHLVDPGVDTGPVVLRRQYRWRGDETARGLEERVYEDCVDLLLRGVELARRGDLSSEAQGPGRYHGVLPRRLRPVAERNLRAFLASRAT